MRQDTSGSCHRQDSGIASPACLSPQRCVILRWTRPKHVFFRAHALSASANTGSETQLASSYFIAYLNQKLAWGWSDLHGPKCHLRRRLPLGSCPHPYPRSNPIYYILHTKEYGIPSRRMQSSQSVAAAAAVSLAPLPARPPCFPLSFSYLRRDTPALLGRTPPANSGNSLAVMPPFLFRLSRHPFPPTACVFGDEIVG